MAKDQKAKEGAKERQPTAKKRQIQSEKRRLENKTFKSRVRTAVRSFEEALKASNSEDTTDKLNELYSLYDKGVKKGVYKANKAARSKSRFAAKVS